MEPEEWFANKDICDGFNMFHFLESKLEISDEDKNFCTWDVTNSSRFVDADSVLDSLDCMELDDDKNEQELVPTIESLEFTETQNLSVSQCLPDQDPEADWSKLKHITKMEGLMNDDVEVQVPSVSEEQGASFDQIRSRQWSFKTELPTNLPDEIPDMRTQLCNRPSRFSAARDSASMVEQYFLASGELISDEDNLDIKNMQFSTLKSPTVVSSPKVEQFENVMKLSSHVRSMQDRAKDRLSNLRLLLRQLEASKNRLEADYKSLVVKNRYNSKTPNGDISYKRKKVASSSRAKPRFVITRQPTGKDSCPDSDHSDHSYCSPSAPNRLLKKPSSSSFKRSNNLRSILKSVKKMKTIINVTNSIRPNYSTISSSNLGTPHQEISFVLDTPESVLKNPVKEAMVLVEVKPTMAFERSSALNLELYGTSSIKSRKLQECSNQKERERRSLLSLNFGQLRNLLFFVEGPKVRINPSVFALTSLLL